MKHVFTFRGRRAVIHPRLLAALVALALVSACAADTREYSGYLTRTAPSSGIASIDVETHSADVVLQPGSGRSIVATAFATGSAVETPKSLTVVKDGNVLRVTWVHESVWCLGDCETRLTITYPGALAADFGVNTRSGDVTAQLASGWHGAGVQIATTSGDVHFTVPTGLHAHLTTSTASGDVHDNVQLTGTTPISISTRSGDITVDRP